MLVGYVRHYRDHVEEDKGFVQHLRHPPGRGGIQVLQWMYVQPSNSGTEDTQPSNSGTVDTQPSNCTLLLFRCSRK